jgi:DNA-binding NtrC family response regulator
METLPDETRARAAPRLQPPQAYLFVLFEAERPLAGGSRHALGSLDEVSIGRGEARAAVRSSEGGTRRLRVTLPDLFLSANHARLFKQDQIWHIEDLGSRNGIRVDGARCDAAPLDDGALIEAGHTLFTIRYRLSGSTDQTVDFDSAAITPPAPGLATLEPAFEREVAALVQVASATVPVLLSGETGTGKEVMARAIHKLSGRAGAYVPVNCGALPETLVESELFGFKKGAFSGALQDRPGLVRAADRGTLFLDEIGDLPLQAQAALLRVLQEREVTPIGETQPQRVDLRVVAASHRSLPELVAAKRFRADLYGRLAGFTLRLPPLRERRVDLGVIVAQLLARTQVDKPSFTPEAAWALASYDWPLNIRELEQRLSTALALAAGAPIDLPHLGELGATEAPPAVEEDADEADEEPEGDSEAQRQRLIAMLTRHRGNVSEVARALDRSRLQVYRWLRRFGLDPRAYRR